MSIQKREKLFGGYHYEFEARTFNRKCGTLPVLRVVVGGCTCVNSSVRGLDIIDVQSRRSSQINYLDASVVMQKDAVLRPSKLCRLASCEYAVEYD